MSVTPYHDHPGFLYLNARPCPFLRGRSMCDIYEIRPYNCRRYLCGRTDPLSDPFDSAPVPAAIVKSRPMRRLYLINQRKAQRWALTHGWQEARES